MLNATAEEEWVKRYDVAYDLYTFNLIKNSEEKMENLEFFVEMLNWTSSGMRMNLTFQNPLYVSRGTKPDIMQMQIKPSARALFISQSTFKKIDHK